MRARKVAAITASLLLAACAGEGDGLDENGRPEGLGAPDGTLVPELQSIQQHVFTPFCTGCHSGAAAPLGLRLDADSAYAMLVNAPSAQAPAVARVAPGNPDASYLIQKLEGRAGTRMPLNADPVPAEVIAVIRQWIADGAAPTAAMSVPAIRSKFDAAEIRAVWPMAGATVIGPPREVVLSSGAELDTTLLSASVVTLRRSGGDADFTNGNEQSLNLTYAVRSLQPTVFALAALPQEWVADHYELRVSVSAPLALADRNARVIDGDGDGTDGGDFILSFTVEIPE